MQESLHSFLLKIQLIRSSVILPPQNSEDQNTSKRVEAKLLCVICYSFIAILPKVGCFMIWQGWQGLLGSYFMASSFSEVISRPIRKGRVSSLQKISKTCYFISDPASPGCPPLRGPPGPSGGAYFTSNNFCVLFFFFFILIYTALDQEPFSSSGFKWPDLMAQFMPGLLKKVPLWNMYV